MPHVCADNLHKSSQCYDNLTKIELFDIFSYERQLTTVAIFENSIMVLRYKI